MPSEPLSCFAPLLVGKERNRESYLSSLLPDLEMTKSLCWSVAAVSTAPPRSLLLSWTLGTGTSTRAVRSLHLPSGAERAADPFTRYHSRTCAERGGGRGRTALPNFQHGEGNKCVAIFFFNKSKKKKKGKLLIIFGHQAKFERQIWFFFWDYVGCATWQPCLAGVVAAVAVVVPAGGRQEVAVQAE